MRKVSLIFLIIISFFCLTDTTKAAAQRDQIDYQINSFDVNTSTGKVTIKGWAIIGGHNNYGGKLTNIRMEAKSPNRADAKVGSVTLQDTSLNYGSNTNYNGNNYCYQRECKQALDTSGNPSKDPETGNYWLTDSFNPARWTYKGNCFYRNMYFTATFDIYDLQYLSNSIAFNLIVDYNTNIDNADKCSVKSSDRATASNILNGIANGKYNWGTNTSKSKIIAVDNNKCKVNGSTCQSSQELTIGGKKVELKVRNSGDTFRLTFDTDYTMPGLSSRNVKKDLICENNTFQSVTEESVSVRITARESNDKCSASASTNILAEYYVVQNGDLKFSLDRGPIYSGGSFTFDIDYVNTTRWYYGDRIDECPQITIPNAKWGSYRCNCHQVCTGEGENKTCRQSCSTCHGCVDSVTKYADNCRTMEDAKALYEAKIPNDIYKDVDNNTKVTLPKDSNSVKNANQKDNVGTWTCDRVVDINGRRVNKSSWSPGEDWITNCRYEFPTAALNKQTADVEYNVNHNDDIWKNEGRRYYIPLKWPSGSFPISADLKGLSAIGVVNWQATYECDVEVKQILYDLDKGGYKFFYRPISLANPFPDRDPSTNWIKWWANEDNRERLAQAYSNLEYRIRLAPNDMRAIKDYNNSKLHNGSRLGYLDYSINANGRSNFFNTLGANFTRQTNDYKRLGEGE